MYSALPAYAELHCLSNFTFLRGASHAAELIERYKIGACSGTPFHVNGVLDAAEADGRDISTLKDMLCGATTVPPTLVDRCAKIGLNTYRSYGSSEHPTRS